MTSSGGTYKFRFLNILSETFHFIDIGLDKAVCINFTKRFSSRASINNFNFSGFPFKLFLLAIIVSAFVIGPEECFNLTVEAEKKIKVENCG